MEPMARAAGAPAGGCPGLRGRSGVVGGVPTGEWARRVIRARDADVAFRALRASAARQLRALRRRGDIPREIVVALDMTAILRYGRVDPGWRVRAMPGHGPARRERRMTAQCAANGMWITVDSVRAVPGDTVRRRSPLCTGASWQRAPGRALGRFCPRVASSSPRG